MFQEEKTLCMDADLRSLARLRSASVDRLAVWSSLSGRGEVMIFFLSESPQKKNHGNGKFLNKKRRRRKRRNDTHPLYKMPLVKLFTYMEKDVSS